MSHRLSQPGFWGSFLEVFGFLGFFLGFFGFFVCLFVFVREREHKQGEQQAEGEAGSPLRKEPDVGLDPETLKS